MTGRQLICRQVKCINTKNTALLFYDARHSTIMKKGSLEPAKSALNPHSERRSNTDEEKRLPHNKYIWQWSQWTLTSARVYHVRFPGRKLWYIKNSQISGRTKKMCRAVQKISPFCSEFYNLVSHHFGFATIFISGSSTVMSLVHGFREASSRSKHPPRQLFVKPFHSATPSPQNGTTRIEHAPARDEPMRWALLQYVTTARASGVTATMHFAWTSTTPKAKCSVFWTAPETLTTLTESAKLQMRGKGVWERIRIISTINYFPTIQAFDKAKLGK